MKVKVSALGLAALAAIALAAALWAEPDFKAILKEIDDLGDFGKQDFSALYTIVSEKPGETPSVIKVRVFRRDERDQFVFLFLEPERQKGQGYFKQDDVIYFYDPKTNITTKSTISETIKNSEARNSDLKRFTFSEDYEITRTSSGKLGKYETWIIELVARTDEPSYQRVRLHVRKDKPLILKEEDLDPSGSLLRTVNFPPKYITVGTKVIPSQMIIEDEVNKGEKSSLTISDVTVGKLDDSVFTKAFLERAR